MTLNKQLHEREQRAARNWLQWKDGGVLTLKQWKFIADVLSGIERITVYNRTTRARAQSIGIVTHDKRDTEMLSRAMWMWREWDNLDLDENELGNPNIVFKRRQRGQTITPVTNSVEGIVRVIENLSPEMREEVLRRVEPPHTVRDVKRRLKRVSMDDILAETVDLHDRLGNLILRVAYENLEEKEPEDAIETAVP